MKRITITFAIAASGCIVGADEPDTAAPDSTHPEAALAPNAKLMRYSRIRDAARARGIGNAYLLAGIANDETGLAMCWSEAQWACKGPASPDCGGGPVIAGAADGP